jgi:hypothetical protein
VTASREAVDRLIADLGAAPCCDRFDDHVESAIAAGFITDLNTTAAAADTATAETPNT